MKVCTEQEYADVDGFVLAPGRRAIVATWVRGDSIWHVDTTDRRGTLAEFAREGCSGLVRPRSRLLGVAGVDAACTRAGGVPIGAR